MTKDFLKSITNEDWLKDCVVFLDDEFFDPQKEVRYWGDEYYFDLNPIAISQPKTLLEQVLEERAYRVSQVDPIFRELSEERELLLINKMERRNGAVGDVDKARQYPIENIIQFKHDFAKCLWHDDKDPSLHFIKDRNTAHCFSCDKSFDSIEAARKVWGLSFKDAVKKLT